MIQSTIDGDATGLERCVGEHAPRAEVLIDVAIDEGGHVTAVTSATPERGALDPALKACIFASLRDLPFPRSGGGAITVRESLGAGDAGRP